MGSEGEHVKSLIPDFEKRNPDIKVKVQAIPWGAAHEKLLTAYAGNATPDLCQLGSTWLAEFAVLDALLPLDSLIERSAIVSPENFFDGVLQTNKIGKRLLGVPWYVDTRVFFYRKDVLARVGYHTAPKTWDEWLDAARKIKRLSGEDVPQYPAFFSLIFNDGYVPVILVMNNDGAFFRDNNRFAAFDDPKTMAALDFYLTFFRENLASKSMTEFTDLFQGFAKADFAMMIHGPWVVNEIRKRYPEIEEKWGTAVLPHKENRLSLAGGASLVIFKNTKYPEAAWKLIEFLSEVETQTEFFRLTRDLPSVREAWQAPELQSDDKTTAFYEQLSDVSPAPQIPEWEQIYVKLQERLETVIHEKNTLPKMVERLNRDVDRMLEKRRWLLERGLIEHEK